MKAHPGHGAHRAVRVGDFLLGGGDATTGAPHVRLDVDLSTSVRTMLVALLPCVWIGIHNTGHQTNWALSALGRHDAEGWRASVLRLTGLGFDPASVAACALHGLLYLLPLLVVSTATAVMAERLFARVRRRRALPGAGLTALLFTLLLPPSLPLWQAALGIAFGVIVGKEIFGGTGRNVFHPAVTGLVFLYFAYPSSLRSDAVWTPVDGHRAADGIQAAALGGLNALERAGATWSSCVLGNRAGGLGDTSAFGCAVGAAYLLLHRAASWRVMASMTIGLVATIALLPASPAFSFSGVPWYWHPMLGSFAFGAVFLATDPVTGSSTNTGRWIHGTLVGSLVALIRVAGPVHADGTLLALMLGSTFAPTIDHAVVSAHIWRRRRRA